MQDDSRARLFHVQCHVMNVMVVDGCERARSWVAEALAQLTTVGLQAAVPDVHGAFAALERMAPDVVVTGTDFDDGDCFDVIEAARRREPPPAVIVLADPVIPAQYRRCLLAGADAYLPRTAGVDELQRAILRVTASRPTPPCTDPSDCFTLIGRVATGVAHDLNNYLAVADLSLTLAERRARDASLREVLAQTRLAVESAIRLNQHLLAYARGGAVTPDAVDLAALVRRVVDMFGSAISPRVDLTLDLLDGLPPVRGISASLEQLVLNLIVNACDAMPDGGALRITARLDGTSMLRLEVTDTGRGVDAAGAAAVGALSPSSKTGRAGSGLGLGIVRSVVERHRGHLSFSRRAGGGTRVTVHLPTCDRR